jgi:hypothetical protein
MPDNDARAKGSSAGSATASPPSYAAATGTLHEEMAKDVGDDYDGPDIESLPPYDEMNPQAGPS